jgi:hypothetical protein
VDIRCLVPKTTKDTENMLQNLVKNGIRQEAKNNVLRLPDSPTMTTPSLNTKPEPCAKLEIDLRKVFEARHSMVYLEKLFYYLQDSNTKHNFW